MKKISKMQYLQALGLFTLASRHYRDADNFDEAVAKMLGIERWSIMSDAAINGGDFDAALEDVGIKVTKKITAKRKNG